MQEFIHQSQSGGIVLLLMTVLALLIANSPLNEGYVHLLETHISLVAGPFVLEETVLHWINDGLMVMFFFVVGLEIKREILIGELSNVRAAALPILAAIGGVIAPALIYTAFNFGRDSAQGWAVPTATDIAFALGCLALLGSRVPFGLKVFLTAVAIVDDLIAVLVIALFYSSDLSFTMLGIGFGVLLLLMLVNLLGIRNPLVYGALGVVVWLAFLNSGIHATISGVLVALTIPARSRIDGPTFLSRVRQILQQFELNQAGDRSNHKVELQESAVLEIEDICEQVQAPLQKLEHSLNGWVSFLIMPLFALANAGVVISPNSLSGETLPVLWGIAAGLVVGKPLGIFAASWLAVRAGVATLPYAVTWRHMFCIGVLAGIGFTMSIFIASLGFGDASTLASAKLAILIGSALAGSLGLFLLSRVPPAKAD
jgi:NhaA family Na+:H+ antiporter